MSAVQPAEAPAPLKYLQALKSSVMAAQQRAPVTLRHGLARLWPSQIASQWYGEMKTHLAHLHPEAMRPDAHAPAQGEAGHDALAALGVPVAEDDVQEALATGEPVRIFEARLCDEALAPPRQKPRGASTGMS